MVGSVAKLVSRLRARLPRPAVVDVLGVGVIVAVAVGCRLVYLHQFRESLMCGVAVGADVREYDAWAREILGGRLLWNELHIHAPLYPYFLALLYAVTGLSLPLVRGLQLLLDVAALLFVYGALRLLWCRRVATLCAVMWAVYQPLVYFSAELISEGLVVFLLSAALFCWALTIRLRCAGALGRDRVAPGRGVVRIGGPQRRSGAEAGSRLPRWACFGLYAGTGLLLGLGAITHPLSLPYGGLFCLLAGGLQWRAGGRWAGASITVVMLAALAVPVALVAWRNTAVSGEFVLIQAREGMNFYIGNNVAATGTCNVRPGPDYERLVNWPRALGVSGERASTAFYYREAMAFIRRHPWQWVQLLAAKLVLTWNAEEIPSGPDLPAFHQQTPFMRLPLLRFGVVGPLALAGVWFCRRRRHLYPFLLLVAVYSAVLTLFVTSGRYRLAMLPGVLAAGAGAVEYFVRTWQVNDRRSWSLGFGLLLVGMGIAFVPQPPPIDGAVTEMAELMAEAAWRQQRLDEARDWLALGLAADSADVRLNHLMGVILAEQGDATAAWRRLETARILAPQDVNVRVDLAVSLSELGRRDEARQELLEALRLQPESAKVFYNLGVLDERAGDARAARNRYRRAIQLDPSLVSAHLNYAVLCHRRRQYAEAEKHYRRALRLAPRRARILTCLAVLKTDTRHVDEAVAYFERSLATDPAQEQVWLLYGRLLRAQGRLGEAEAVARRAVGGQQGHGAEGEK